MSQGVPSNLMMAQGHSNEIGKAVRVTYGSVLPRTPRLHVGCLDDVHLSPSAHAVVEMSNTMRVVVLGITANIVSVPAGPAIDHLHSVSTQIQQSFELRALDANSRLVGEGEFPVRVGESTKFFPFVEMIHLLAPIRPALNGGTSHRKPLGAL